MLHDHSSQCLRELSRSTCSSEEELRQKISCAAHGQNLKDDLDKILQIEKLLATTRFKNGPTFVRRSAKFKVDRTMHLQRFFRRIEGIVPNVKRAVKKASGDRAPCSPNRADRADQATQIWLCHPVL
jgi:hypothetical protein